MPEALFDPNVAFLMLVVGIIALSWELHAPGMFGPGLIGIILLCAGVFGAILLASGAVGLIRGPHAINPVLAVAVAAAVCVIAIFLGFLGLKARRAAVVSGIETLVGQVGVSRTDIGLQGTVFVRGEYWQAKSDSPI